MRCGHGKEIDQKSRTGAWGKSIAEALGESDIIKKKSDDRSAAVFQQFLY
jgi:hypothetical protein